MFAKGHDPLLFFLHPFTGEQVVSISSKKNPCVYAKHLSGDGFEPAHRLSASCKDCRMLD